MLLQLLIILAVLTLHSCANVDHSATANSTATKQPPADHFDHTRAFLSPFALRYVHQAKFNYHKRFQDKCMKYPFVHKYLKMIDEETLKNSTDQKYLVYIFHNHMGQVGGIGDRVAGLISAIGFALRTNRIVLLHGDKAVEDYFEPYRQSGDQRSLKWSTWKWAQYESHFGRNLNDLYCVNTLRPGPCYLDDAIYLTKRVVRYIGNRAYLCRWAAKPELDAFKDLQELGITQTTDLYEAAGCMLRLVLHPSERLWKDVGRFVDHNLHLIHHPDSVPIEGEVVNTTKSEIQNQTNAATTTKVVNRFVDSLKNFEKVAPDKDKLMMQVGTHFRCGDEQMKNDPKALPCIAEANKPWKGINFYDEYAMESPEDISNCVVDSFSNPDGTDRKGFSSKLIFVASDNRSSADQMSHNTHKNWHHTLLPQHICHVDSTRDNMCGHMTFLQWFILSLSDVVISQSLSYAETRTENGNFDVGQISLALQAAYPPDMYPPSAFSRYSAVYGLSRLRFGTGCKDVNTTSLAHRSHSNWRCDSAIVI